MSDNVTDPNINRNEHDDTGGVLGKRIKNYVWNSGTLAWDKMTQTAASSSTTPAISVSNSSTATLTSNSTFTGTGEDITSYREVRVSVFADVASAADGLSLQQSPDNTNWDVLDKYTIPAMTSGQGKTYAVPRDARYFRVVYTNGGTNQATFRLQTIFNPGSSTASSQRAQDAYTNETDLEQTQSFLMAFNGSTWDRIRSVGTGILSASISDSTGNLLQVAQGSTTSGQTGPLVQGAVSTNNPAYSNGQTSPFSLTATGLLRAQVASSSATGSAAPANAFYLGANNGTSLQGLNTLPNVADGQGGSGTLSAGVMSFNNTTYDRTRNNTTGVVIAAGATTAQTSATQVTYNAKRLHVVINISAFTSGTLTFTVNALTSSGYTYPLLVSTALAATGTTVLKIFDGATPTANLTANDSIPRSFNVVVSGTFSATYGVDFNLGI